MENYLFTSRLIVKKSEIHGYGVFAKELIKKGQVIEECLALTTAHPTTLFGDFLFKVDDEVDAMILGYGSIYNHSDQPNADFLLDVEKKIMTFRALRDIKSKEEILINYGEDWFSSRNLLAKKVIAKKSRYEEISYLIRFSIVLFCLILIFYIFKNL